ncbi:hypothetical protein SLEP1_g14039 [Rubroshorea leprosula]|uniref:Uncharacterized protein n=1 Tax=Rubroshorea leprosula TaxID=152421 RepID=A0AAV5INL2_9ROSI|nr:hypothetical protein SLEP1_g14039 [Rubroshorea leprosula]
MFVFEPSLSVYDETLEETQDYSSHPFRRAGLLEYVLQGNLRANSTDLQPGFGHATWLRRTLSWKLKFSFLRNYLKFNNY